jgi:PAS domain S-box-containing protein
VHPDREHAERLFEQASDSAYIVDPMGDRILAANAAGCAMLGYTHAEMLATPISDIHPAEMGQMRELANGALHDGQASTIRLTCRTKQGTYLPTEIALLAFESDGRRYLLSLVQDRSEHRQAKPGR